VTILTNHSKQLTGKNLLARFSISAIWTLNDSRKVVKMEFKKIKSKTVLRYRLDTLCTPPPKKNVTTFLADRTNGRAYATVLRLSSCVVVVVCRLWRYVLWLNGAS